MASQATEPPPPSASPQREPCQSDEESSASAQKSAIEVQNDNPRSQSSASETDGSRKAKTGLARRRGRRDMVQNQQHKDEDRGEYITQAGHQSAPQNQLVQNKGRDAPSVRLDMNLDIDIELKAKVKGDVTLSILGGNQGRK